MTSYIQQQYLAIPKVKVTVDDEEITNDFIRATITLKENAYWQATVTFSNLPALYPTTVNANSDITIQVQDAAVGGSWQTLFVGTVLFPDYSFSNAGAFIVFQCVGYGYGLNMMNCGEEYGVQSIHNTLDTAQEILTNGTYGIIPKYANQYMGTHYVTPWNSGYNINTTYVDNVSGVFQYISFPWKPIDKCLDDLCDLNTAIVSPSAGLIWIVDNTSHLRVKQLGTSQTGWTKYFGNSQANATLATGEDFKDGDFQPISKQANIVLYSGIWRRPNTGDTWTNYPDDTTVNDNWVSSASSTLTSDGSIHQIGSYSIRATSVGAGNPIIAAYPYDEDAAWDFSVFPNFAVPFLNFYILRHDVNGVAVYLKESPTKFFYHLFTTEAPDQDKWYHLSYPVGTYYQSAKPGFFWDSSGGPNWNNINSIEFLAVDSSDNDYICIDGLNFGGSSILRVAREPFPGELGAGAGGTLGLTKATNPLASDANSGQANITLENATAFSPEDTITISDSAASETGIIAAIMGNQLSMYSNLSNTYLTSRSAKVTRSANPVRFKVYTDNIGKDDSLNADDDSGLLAQLAKAELLRLSKPLVNGTFSTRLIPSILPGQYVYFDSKDWRITKLTHNIEGGQGGEFKTVFEVTDDLTNSHTRQRYEDINKVYEAIRPEWQDRQASSIKSISIDIRIWPLEKAYDI